MRTKGYDKKTAKWWLRSIYRDYRRSGPKDYLEIFWAHRHGFRINTVKSYGINKDNYKDYMAEKDYYYISDINGIYKKWVSDKVSYRNILEPFSEHLPKQFFTPVLRTFFIFLIQKSTVIFSMGSYPSKP